MNRSCFTRIKHHFIPFDFQGVRGKNPTRDLWALGRNVKHMAFNFVRNVCKYNVWNGCNFNMTYDFIPRCRAQDACEILNQNPPIMQNFAWIGLWETVSNRTLSIFLDIVIYAWSLVVATAERCFGLTLAVLQVWICLGWNFSTQN